MRGSKDHATLIKIIERRPGWSVERRRGGGHYRVRGPDGATVFTSHSPSDRRALLNFRRDLRAAGWLD